MNRKQEYLNKIVDICVKCCGYALSNGKLSITREDILGKNRNENVVMTRCIAVSMMLRPGLWLEHHNRSDYISHLSRSLTL